MTGHVQPWLRSSDQLPQHSSSYMSKLYHNFPSLPQTSPSDHHHYQHMFKERNFKMQNSFWSPLILEKSSGFSNTTSGSVSVKPNLIVSCPLRKQAINSSPSQALQPTFPRGWRKCLLSFYLLPPPFFFISVLSLDRNLNHNWMPYKNLYLHGIIFSNMVFVMKKVTIM